MKYTATPIPVTNRIKAAPLFPGVTGQDGVIHGDFLFRFNADGSCRVFSLSAQQQISIFLLDRLEILKPHCNTVCFGAEKYRPSDEFPLLYANIYNNYAKEEDRLEGVVCVYRLTRTGNEFATTLLQVIRIGFVEELSLWKSLPGNGDIRPYGNFLPDPLTGKLHAYVLRDKEHVTRFFTFDLPALSQGEYHPAFGVKVVTLLKKDVQAMFDCDYTGYIQGGCCYGGLLFNIAGGTVKSPDCPHPPRLQVVDMQAGKQLTHLLLADFGLTIEPEMIDFEGDTLYYMDASGQVNTLEFV